MFDHALTPDCEKNVFERWRHVVDLSADLIQKIGRICHRGTERRKKGQRGQDQKRKNDLIWWWVPIGDRKSCPLQEGGEALARGNFCGRCCPGRWRWA